MQAQSDADGRSHRQPVPRAGPPSGTADRAARMRIAVLCQEDYFAIPENIERLLAIEGVEVSLIAVLDSSGALLNRKAVFARGFGPLQAARMAAALLAKRSVDALDAIFRYRLTATKRSVRAVAGKHRIPFRRIGEPNRRAFLDYLQGLEPDLVISYSAPCVFRRRLLAIPRLGCVNLHGSLLPLYAGLLPSFWVLYHREEETGATVHFMDNRIDNGAILGQVRVPIDPGTSMFRLIQRTKEAGGELMAEVVRGLMTAPPETRPNRSEEGSYFSWPTVEQIREFRQRGGRLI